MPGKGKKTKHPQDVKAEFDRMVQQAVQILLSAGISKKER